MSDERDDGPPEDSGEVELAEPKQPAAASGRRVVHKGRAGFAEDFRRAVAKRRREQAAAGDGGARKTNRSARERELSRRPPDEDVRELKPRLQAFVIVGALIMLSLVGRLFQLQILEGVHFARRAEQNYVDTIDVEAPRGRIFDSQGRPLATNHATYALYVTAIPRVQVEGEDGEDAKVVRLPIDDQQVIELGALIDFVDEDDRARFVEKLERLRDDERNGRYAVAVRNNLSWEENARIQTRGFDTWVEIRESARRYYAERELAAFVTGFMREISRDSLEDSRYGDYRPGDRVGVTGIERQWENYLRGRLGKRSRVVDALGREVAEPPPAAVAALPPEREPIPGQDIYLSLDLDLQRVAATALAGESMEGEAGERLNISGIKRAGGVVALEVETGRILAMVSVPSIDPNVWEGRITRQQYEDWLNSPFKPFVDKTVQENFFPGSTYKVVSALAALEDPNFDPHETIECEGHVEYGGRKFTEAAGHRHGIVDLEQAIVQSCNVYFYHLAIDKDLTLARMEEVARRLGLGERTGLGINAEVPGVIPTEASESRQGTFQRGVRLNSAIGQGNVKATVLQIAVLYAALANGGFVVTPSLVDRVETSDGKLVLETSPKYKQSDPVIAPFDAERIHRGLIGVVNSDLGTAYSERLETVTVAGKTGTAEVGIERGPDEDIIEGWDVTKDHAWFAGYAPAENPEIVVVALVAHGGVGADAAAPIVMRVIDHYLGSKGASGDSVRPRAPGVPPPLPGEEARARQAEIEQGL
ncbi:peptidoglycan glycosyltransferase [Plesiocystis pacifica SIR-1]|uniref:Peptidoglycan glycosyltransferase n=1 Tax=Plesiocystis pacifica SIR-1 TaxID=391625 RepID=A6GGV6_9BACT|nr:penicillin-binding protein 2 [Plesiocystis pacifica]EDM74897.1 peptidoglycan glycosyltransferase [Plesiocystis pacifica SIR-1]